MLAALFHGKVSRSVDGYEDMMTSVVFGLIQHLPPALGIRPVLAHMKAHPLPGWLGSIESIDAEFWPWWDEAEERDGAEPDVVLTLGLRGGRPRLLVVEAKRGSGKHGHGQRDQLARQVANGYRIAERRDAEMAGLVYVTTHLHFAGVAADLGASKAELGPAAPPLWWLSWRDLTPILRQAAEALAPYPLAAMSGEASACLERWGMVRFRGWSKVAIAPPFTFEPLTPPGPVLPVPPWTFEATPS